MGKIIELTPEIYNRIAAGEVIENPASVVKELLENSLDAESTEINIKVISSGKKEINIVDNGTGMDKDDIHLAIKKHSTSKIKHIKDLNSILSFGFRGEALSSVISVSIVDIISKIKNMNSAVKLHIENSGKKIEESRAASNQGTSISVFNLFYNTPARFKFLKSDRQELLNIKNIITKTIIPQYKISFKIIYDDNKPKIFRSRNNLFDRIKDIYGDDFCKELISFKKEFKEFTIHGFMGNPSFNKSNRNYQYLFLNNRPITTKYFSYWLTVGYENFLMKHRYPVAFIFIEAPSDFYDVNVHPAKQEVRFVNEYLLSNALISTIKDNLNKKSSIPEINKTENIVYNYDNKKRKIVTQINNSINTFFSKNKESIKKDYKEYVPKHENNNVEIDHWNIPDYTTIFNTYIVYEAANKDYIYLIDQHAAHERILYENMKTKIKDKDNLKQNLLIPIHVKLSDVEHQLVLDNKETFKKLGYIIDDFGDNSIIINSVPSFLQHIHDKQLFLDIVSDLLDKKEVKNTNIHDKIMKSMACRSAIKAGDNISKEQKDLLIKQLFELENKFTCPHGRPSIIKLNKSEIEKWFKRK